MSFETALAILSFGFSLLGLTLQVFPGDARKRVIAILVVLVVLTGHRLYLNWQHQGEVKFVAGQICRNLDTQGETFEELYGAHHVSSLALVNEALDELIRDHRVGDKVVECTDQLNRLRFYPIRVYFSSRADNLGESERCPPND